ncbi:Cytochrome P450 alkane hydroxylase, putative [Penicillium digitatum PHI26]|uniref:Cytochrome P450 alkane hydroxylase, putative n=2 Tax=Penicillium digitatum TaxID=36651 RepID=K9FVY1_PEND2|nr:Cytochrome P450 alkane hydroxylase, putative [Penicillium digitatum Pd1]EKV13299.1 Cytochrome P450 alkane hydroxylase, putative [Penicillium digitatum PHI26]EKV19173.1 Cytochrome P450 alkane hydroxylase, putative [Penicillium digitatum Pd1]
MCNSAKQSTSISDEFIQPYFETVLSHSAGELKEKISRSETFLDALASFTRDPRVLRDQLIAVLLAGRDTTAATLFFCIFELSRNPKVVAKLRDEIHNRLGVGAKAQKPSYTDLKEMKYLNAMLHETMRLYPVVPFKVRYSLRDTTLPRGGGVDGLAPVGVRANSRIFYSTMLMQRDPDLYDGPGSENYFEPGDALPVGGKGKVEDPVLHFEVTLSPGSELNCVFLKEGEEAAHSAATTGVA